MHAPGSIFEVVDCVGAWVTYHKGYERFHAIQHDRVVGAATYEGALAMHSHITAGMTGLPLMRTDGGHNPWVARWLHDAYRLAGYLESDAVVQRFTREPLALLSRKDLVAGALMSTMAAQLSHAIDAWETGRAAQVDDDTFQQKLRAKVRRLYGPGG